MPEKKLIGTLKFSASMPAAPKACYQCAVYYIVRSAQNQWHLFGYYTGADQWGETHQHSVTWWTYLPDVQSCRSSRSAVEQTQRRSNRWPAPRVVFWQNHFDTLVLIKLYCREEYRWCYENQELGCAKKCPALWRGCGATKTKSWVTNVQCQKCPTWTWGYRKGWISDCSDIACPS